MEVTKRSFNWHLPRMLKDLSECCCVALDMEFSGIAVRPSDGSPASHGSRSTIQERYLEVKAAAETYQILQVGLTFVEEDAENGSYTLRPYNLHLSPLLDSKLDVERRWSYQSSAVDFLTSNGFRMEAPFTEGIPYISRDEEATARRRSQEWQTRRAATRDITVDQMDADTIQFVEKTRRYIDSCIGSGELEKDGYINIPNAADADVAAGPDLSELTINNYQKRLVHQLVRTEYPDLVSMGRPTFVQIIRYDKQREEGLQESKLRTLQGRLSKQTGFRWIVEALVGGDISGLDPWCFTSVINEPTGVDDEKILTEYFDHMQAKLKSRRPVLAGHNLLVDLVYLYRTFIGELPDRVEEFQQAIHELFPLVVDTKYMATHKCWSSKTASSLDEVDKVLLQRKTPTLVTDSQHSKYLNGKSLHEAGYDSVITAQIFLRLSAELHERTALKDQEGSKEAPSPSGESPQPWAYDIDKKTDRLIDVVEPNNNVMSLAALDRALNKTAANRLAPTNGIPSTGPRQRPVNWREPAEVARIQSIFAHRNKFDLLTDQTEETVTLSTSSNIIKYDPILDPEAPLLDFPEELAMQQKVDNGELIPRFDSDFWQTYGNKLRVFGTAEEICVLTSGGGG